MLTARIPYYLLLFTLFAQYTSIYDIQVIHFPPYTNCNSDEISNTPMGLEIELIRSAAKAQSLKEGTDFKFTCHGNSLENLGAKNRKKLFEDIMGNQTSQFMVVGGIPLTEKYIRKYAFSYMTYESTLNGIYKPEGDSKFFYFEQGFETVYAMLLVCMVGVGTFITIYELNLAAKTPGENTSGVTIIDEWFKNTWIS